MTKSQIFFSLLLAFIAGVAAASFVSFGTYAIAAIFILGGSIASFGLLRRGEGQRVLIFGCAAAVFAFGAFWFFREDHSQASMLTEKVGMNVAFEGIVTDEPVRRPQSQEIMLQGENGERRVRVIMRPYPEYHYGSRLRATGRLTYDDVRSEFRIAFPDVLVVDPNGGNMFYQMLLRLKEEFSSALTRHLPEPEASFLSGLLLGERQNFPASLRRDLQITGTAHIVALSGYNITIVADALLRAATLLWLPLGAAWWLTLAGIAVFTLLTGAAASVVRAAIMGGLVLVARRAGRMYHMQNALALAAVIMLLHDPSILRFNIGFQLSFLATLGLLYVAPLIDRVFERMKVRLMLFGRDSDLLRERRGTSFAAPQPSFLRGILVSTLAAQVAVLPLLIFYFGELSIIAPLANLAILPLIPATMFAGFVTGGAGFIADPLGRFAALVSRLPLSYELSAIYWFAALPAASVSVHGSGRVVLAALYALLAFFVWRARRSHFSPEHVRHP